LAVQTPTQDVTATQKPTFTFNTHPDHYKHWRLEIDGPIAHLKMQVQEDGGLRDDYKLKLNSYDLGVDIELQDAVNRLRFEHPDVSVVCIESGLEGVFCAGANIFMLATSPHAHKVNFCKYTNETRNAIEEATARSGQRYVASVTGPCSGGGYELAMACEEIHLIHDRNSAVSLPEVPYLGVLPGTGGLTRLVDKRKVRRDRADIFCTLAEGIKGERAVEWGFVDFLHPSSTYKEKLAARLKELAGDGNGVKGITLNPIQPTVTENGLAYEHVALEFADEGRRATLHLKGPAAEDATIPPDPASLGSDWYALKFWRELEDAILQLRFNYETCGLISITSKGDPQNAIDLDDALGKHRDNWLVREVTLLIGRVLKRLDVTARSFFAIIEPGSCFAGSFLEIALAADRIYMLDDDDGKNTIGVSAMNGGVLPMGHGLSRLQNRFYGNDDAVAAVMERSGQTMDAGDANNLGLVTDAPDELDWEDEIRVAVEERMSLSPDALTGLEANLRFVGPETTESRIFGRLSAWQNWIFTRPNATGDAGALTSYGKPTQPKFDWRRT
jgi:benzoyl-CoA-dihydrodiol lyase